MAKKLFVSKSRLVKGDRWYIDFTRIDVETGIETRHRQDFGLNDIADETIREGVANVLVKNLTTFTRYDQPRPKEPDSVPVRKAVEFAVGLKQLSKRKNTRRSYTTIPAIFMKWAERSHYAGLPVKEFKRKHAKVFLRWLASTGKYTGCTINNYHSTMRALWSEMIEEEMTTENPWKGIKPEREEEKKRRNFTLDEQRIVAKHVEETDYWMFRGILLQYFCYIRPVELTRLKLRDFDLGRGLVTVTEAAAKEWKKSVKTIPKAILPYFRDGRFDKYPTNYYMYGLKKAGPCKDAVEPSTTPIGDDRMYKRHVKVLKRLHESGELRDITGLTWYSWKDTGISVHAHKTTPLATRDQAGHSDFDMTLTYYHQDEVNAEYAALPNDLF